jgi:putative radical SAM enzyme (TIGR03279 family)
MIRVTAVHPGTVADELGLLPGTELIAVNGRPLEDFLDWEFLTADEEFLLHVRQPDGEEIEYDLERPLDVPMGVSLEPPRIRRCANRCDFCFVDGLPEGLRETLYIRDDDYRLSFKYGNFATLTNLKPKDIERIIEYRLSPLYVSVHCTDPVLRRYLLRNPGAPDILEQLRLFAGHGIVFHTQVVMSPGVNDGPVLRQTLKDLYAFGEHVLNASVVPVGLTEFSKHDLVREPTAQECRASLEIVQEFAARARRERGINWAFGADELYLRAGVELPRPESYDGFQQVENGVGSVRFLQERIREGVSGPGRWTGWKIGVVTGTSMAALMPQVLPPLAAATGAQFEIIPAVNSLFGSSVTCAGLLPGAAFRTALAGRKDLGLALLPRESLNDDGFFMDDLTLADLQATIPIPVHPSYDFVDVLAGGPEGIE